MLISTSIRKLRLFLHHKEQQTRRISRKSIEFICLLIGTGLVASGTYTFAKLADFGLELNRAWVHTYPYLVWIVLPLGLAILAWFTQKFTPYVAGSGIPQVIASISLPYGNTKERLVMLGQAIWKIPLTFLAMCIGGSVGREGPSVQVGAAVMLAWGKFCRKYNLAFKGLSSNELMATGAAGGLAAAFNAPLAGVIFAIEELGRGTALRWEGRVLLGVMTTGFILVLLQGNNPYFPRYTGVSIVPNILLWVAICAVICGILGGFFARLLSKGLAAYTPSRWRGWVRKHPVIISLFLGLLLAALGTFTHHSTYGTGYPVVTQALDGQDVAANIGLSKLFATVFTYWSGIAGGIFTPALTTGAAIGTNIWQISGGLVDQRFLVLLCMAAFLAAATQAPVTASVIVMEMTGAQTELVWILATSLVASIVSRQICPKPFYHFAASRYRQRIQEEAKVESDLSTQTVTQVGNKVG
ncbi:chloride channel protein EriC [Mergibacter septicus]|uniref:chloride channel protein n=1 Tax=Mergibacter septicus TaxID=221402 RepID=UPI001178EDAC|nr:chloride channel protein [Mergibacter septicus]AWX14016.1 chloride channel protein EriC [Mergibacter septicus]